MKQEQIDALRHLPIPDQGLLIDGQWTAAASGHSLPVVSPIDGQQLCTIAAAGQADVDRAVQAARRSFEQGVWSRMAPAERKKILHRIADRIETHHAELAELTPRHGAFSTPPFDAAVALVARGIAGFFVRQQFKKWGCVVQAFQHVHRIAHRELQPAAEALEFGLQVFQALLHEAEVLPRGIGLAPQRRLQHVKTQHRPQTRSLGQRRVIPHPQVALEPDHPIRHRAILIRAASCCVAGGFAVLAVNRRKKTRPGGLVFQRLKPDQRGLRRATGRAGPRTLGHHGIESISGCRFSGLPKCGKVNAFIRSFCCHS